MVNQEESKMYYYFKEHPDVLLQESTNETTILQQVPPHPNIAGLVHRCKSSTEGYAKHVKKLDREDAKVAYTVAPTGEFLFLPYCEKSLAEYLAEQKQQQVAQLSSGITEEDILTILAQLLLGISHLKRHHVAHCAITPENVLIDEGRKVLMLTNFSYAVNLKPRSLDAVRSAVSRLKCNSSSRVLAPEVFRSVQCLNAESSYFQENLEKLLRGNDCYAAGRIIYEFLLSRSLGFCELEHYTQEDIPYLESLSPRCNQILKKLVACDPAERFSALEGAMCCMLLLFGPRATEMTSLDDCHQWMFSENMEFFMKPVLQRSSVDQSSEAGSKLHYIYLTIANPERIWDTCRFFK